MRMHKEKTSKLIVPQLPPGYFYIFKEGDENSVLVCKRLLGVFYKVIIRDRNVKNQGHDYYDNPIDKNLTLKQQYEKSAAALADSAHTHHKNTCKAAKSKSWTKEEMLSFDK